MREEKERLRKEITMDKLNFDTFDTNDAAFELVRKDFTNKVAKYLANGYRFCFETLHSSQGEIAHTDLLKGDEVVKILVKSEYEKIRNGCEDFYVIQVGINSKSKVFKGCFPTIWNQDLKIVEETKYLYRRICIENNIEQRNENNEKKKS